jgi:hypothetical protein
MSMLSKYIDRYIAKKIAKFGKKGAILWAVEKIVKKTPTKKDDEMFEVVKKALDDFDN